MNTLARMGAILGLAVQLHTATWAQELPKPQPPVNPLNPPVPAPAPKMSIEVPPLPADPPPIQGSTAQPGPNTPLFLDEVLQSVEASFPRLRAIEQERAIANGQLLSTMGQFDLNINAFTRNIPLGTYESYRTDFLASQAYMNSGVTTFAGYRTGFGEFPSYGGAAKTADGGEFRVGLTQPLLRDRRIDRRRANLQQAEINRALAEPTIEQQRIDFLRAAARVYWVWVAAGQRLEVAKQLYQLAAERDRQLEERVKAGPGVEFERIDNLQNLTLRGNLLVEAERAFQRATIDLSLFLRDANGEPILAGLERVPDRPPAKLPDDKDFGKGPKRSRVLVDPLPPNPDQFGEALKMAFEQRPELRRLRLQREFQQVELRQAENLLLPALNFVLSASQDVGLGKPSSGPSRLDRQNIDAGLVFEVPVQRRDAEGRILQARARIAQINHLERFQEDVIRAEVQDTFSALERAYEFWKQASIRTELAERVAVLERQRFLLGQSNVLTVTLRELAAFEARNIEINAKADYFRALADYRAALGIGATPSTP